MFGPETAALTTGGVLIIAIERLIAVVKAQQARRNGDDTNELLHRILEGQIVGNTTIENLVQEIRDARR